MSATGGAGGRLGIVSPQLKGRNALSDRPQPMPEPLSQSVLSSAMGVSNVAVIEDPDTSVTVYHGWGSLPVPRWFNVTPTNDMGAATKWWIDHVSRYELTIAIDAAPGVGETAEFVWQLIPLSVAGEEPASGVLPVTSGLALWLDSNEIAGLSDNDPIETWPDLSGNGFDFVQLDSAKQPVFRTGIANGHPIARFDGTNDVMNHAANAQVVNASTGAWTAFAVALRDTTGSAVQGIVTGDPSSGNRIAQFLRYNSAIPQSIVWAGSVTDSAATATGNQFNVEEAVRTTTTVERLVNGATNGTTAAVSPVTTAGPLGLGVATLTPTGFWRGDIAEVLIYDRVLTSTERDDVRAYLTTKWGIVP